MIDLDELSRINTAGDRYGHITPGVVAELIGEVRRLREDRDRYQWLKAHWGHRTPILNGLFPRSAVDDAFDAGIDAARAKERA